MTAYSINDTMETRPRGLSGATAVGSDYSALAGEGLSFSDISGNHDDGIDDLIQRILRRDCASVCQLAASCAPDIRRAVGNIASNIAADLETRVSALRKGRTKDPRSKGHAIDPPGHERANNPLDAWATDILKWSRRQSSTQLAADYVTPLFESFMLFVAHHIKAHFRQHGDTGFLKSGDCRLILPIANMDMEAEPTGSDSPDYVNPTDFANIECGMFPPSSSVKRQATPASHLIVGDAVIAREQGDYSKAERMLAKKTKALFISQHHRRFAWGLTASNREIHAYTFGPDDIWASTAINITSSKGRWALISLLVDWSLCPIDRLGFDPSIRYLVDKNNGSPYLEIDVDKMDESTGRVEQRTYYSQRCVGAADCLTGRHDRYFAASTSLEMLDTPEFLVKEMWTISNSDSASYAYESWFINELHAEFDQSSEFSGRFPQIVSTGPVYINRGGTLVLDSTVTAFAGLPTTTQDATENSGKARGSSKSKVQSPSSSRVRQHRRTVTKWAGTPISAVDNPSQAVIAIADAMAALNEAYLKCKIIHGNLSDRAIFFRETADGIKGILGEFDYASYSGDSADAFEAAELSVFKYIRCLADAGAARTRLDDWESLLYLVCWLGTFGINATQRREYVADPNLAILDWNRGSSRDIAETKRDHMDSAHSFNSSIASKMFDGPLRRLAVDIHRALFLHPDCYGSIKLSNDILERVDEVVISHALRVGMATGALQDPLTLRISFEGEIVENLISVLAQHRDVALKALENAAAAERESRAATPASAAPTKKRQRDQEPYAHLAGPAKRTRQKTSVTMSKA
ncbi:hypothetical protein GGH93_005737 [Coemansia aciculifera]|nr:hypothetical protein GGH93_005737 [Coemansia aciculifera]